MHDESLNQQPDNRQSAARQSIAPQFTDHDALSANANRELDLRLIRALENAPALQIPADFAARITTRTPAHRPVSLSPTYYGYYAMLISMVVLLAAMLILARHTVDHTTLGLTLHWVLCAQFIAIGVWISAHRHNAG
jgi:hypothetical protein